MAGLAQPLRMRRKAGPDETWIYFDPDDADALGPAWGLVKQGGEWWWHDELSHFTVSPGRMVKLNAQGRYAGSAELRYFWNEYETVDEE
jgi:hypothetical protein